MENDEILHKYLNDLYEDRENGTLWLKFPQSKTIWKEKTKNESMGETNTVFCALAKLPPVIIQIWGTCS